MARLEMDDDSFAIDNFVGDLGWIDVVAGLRNHVFYKSWVL
jgi:hypothetical protein